MLVTSLFVLYADVTLATFALLSGCMKIYNKLNKRSSTRIKYRLKYRTFQMLTPTKKKNSNLEKVIRFGQLFHLKNDNNTIVKKVSTNLKLQIKILSSSSQ